MESDAYFLAKVLLAIFKNRPSRAYAVFALIIVLVLGAMLLSAHNPSDRAFPILGLVFVFIVVLGQIIQSIRQQSVQDFQEMEDTLFEHEPPPPQVTEHIYLPSRAEENQPEHKPPSLRSRDHLYKAPAKKSPGLITFVRYLRSAPGTIRTTLAERGPAETSIAASKFSGALFLVINALSIALAFAAFPCLIIASPLLANPKLDVPLGIMLVAPFVPAMIITLLSALAALGLALVAIFTRAENKSRAVLALLVSVLSLIGYTIVGLGVLAFSE